MPVRRSYCPTVRRLVRTAAVVATLSLGTGTAFAGDLESHLPNSGTGIPAITVAKPVVPRGLPTGIEKIAAYVGGSSCDPRSKPGVVALGKLLVRTYPGTHYGIDRTCAATPSSEHNEGRAIDWMVSVRKPIQAAQARTVIAWLLAKDTAGRSAANARRLGVMYVIWNNKMWRAYDPDGGWREYQSCSKKIAKSSDTTCHRDHVHISLSWEGAMSRTSFWSKQVTARDYGPCRPRDLNWAAPYRVARGTPCPSYPKAKAPAGASALRKTLTAYSGQVLRRGSTGAGVRAVQQAVRATADGSYGPATTKAVSTWQRAHGLPADGVLGHDTWRALLKATR